ncbi:glycoside hydrolase family 15 [Actinotalea sp. K2]|uniref:glycoside hydrolase family 15 n=1 Tax=Actinotalea sp. K2 TaxID=2939438 RepID=UPI0020175C29|nr:glycoside hydrolase family 15 [Actinotalea sp. K2]MCL3862574.1 glycoside hydrolase family 15 [Actinotalea sp. K2]
MLPSSRRLRALAGLAAVCVLVGAASAGSSVTQPYEEIPLYSDGVLLGADGMPHLVPVGGAASEDAAVLAAQDAWLAEGVVPGPERYRDMAERALRDLDALVLENGASIAAASTAWRYVWPRDASFTAAALARTGHPEDAHAVLAYLQDMQDRRSTDGVFEARYLPDGSGDVPDGRGLQLDGNGWVLWAVAQWYAAAPPGPGRDRGLEALRPLVERSLDAIRSRTDPTSGVPEVFPDYWEVAESVPTLGTLAPLLLGVRSAEPVLVALGAPAETALERLLATAVDTHFAPVYPRHLGGRLQDTAVAFLMPPFAPPDGGVRRAWQEAAVGMARPAGGLAPGEGWKEDGISWTPETALFALTAAASGDLDQAHRWLGWLDEHRTARGSLPEKVLWDGRPSAVAPLAWTASVVLLTLDEIDRADQVVAD